MRRTPISSKPLNPSFAEARRVDREIRALIMQMSKEYKQAFAKRGTMDSDITDYAKSVLNRLGLKYEALFNVYAERWANRIGNAALSQADKSLRINLKEVSKDYQLKSMDLIPGTDAYNKFKAITTESANLFKTIPAKFHQQVSGSVLNAISSGQGSYDLVKYFDKFTDGARNYAKLRALDQTRKAFTGMALERMQNAGIKKFKWVATGGGETPRPLHHNVLDGNIYDIDSPPFIGVMYGQDVYGYPSQLPNCRCRLSAIILD